MAQSLFAHLPPVLTMLFNSAPLVQRGAYALYSPGCYVVSFRQPVDVEVLEDEQQGTPAECLRITSAIVSPEPSASRLPAPAGWVRLSMIDAVRLERAEGRPFLQSVMLDDIVVREDNVLSIAPAPGRFYFAVTCDGEVVSGHSGTGLWDEEAAVDLLTKYEHGTGAGEIPRA